MTVEEIVAQAKDDFGIKKFIGLFSGGKDSLVACHVLWKMGLLNEVLYCKTGIGLEENFNYVLEICNKYHWKLNIEEPEPRFSYENYVRKWGFPSPRNHNIVMGNLKWFSIRRFEKKHRDEKIGFISGARSKESKRRFRTHKFPVERPKGDKNLCFVKPLFYWKTSEVWDYLRENELEICPVYNTLHLSGDCLCGAFAETHESKLISIFHPEMAKRIAELEKRYGGKWGRHTSMRGAMKQGTLDSLVCYECKMNEQ